MCEQCDALGDVLGEVMGAKASELIMKRVRARVHREVDTHGKSDKMQSVGLYETSLRPDTR